uniref:30S ribosomal protein S20 n=1 Tax=Phyllymenia taiwanensis TaxID=1260292 RepID=R9XWR7_9FLOR|nr:30S ribosomal protein S20 [Grateloupia taiwanensis]AGO19917.1 30S ribosomal protein S20 [Grateloupia taiwanensis]
MPKNLSALKKTQISLRNRARNKIYKSVIKTLTKKYIVSLKQSKDINIYKNNLAAVYQKIDKAVKRGIMHKNTASRKKSLLAKLIKTNITT